MTRYRWKKGDAPLPYTIEASIDYANQIIQTKLLDGALRVVTRNILHVQEEQTRKALMALGWTPPSFDFKKQVERSVEPQREFPPRPFFKLSLRTWLKHIFKWGRDV